MFKLWVALLALLYAGDMAPGVEVRGTATFQDRPLADAVVWIDAPAQGPSGRRRAVLDQRNLKFSPRVLAVQVGTTVDFPNNDRVFHDVFSFRDGKRFELGLYPVGGVKHVRELAREALVRGGYRVFEAVNGEEGVRVATEQAGCIDLVVTDVVMPVMGGRELAARLTAMWPDLRILFTSGYTDDTMVREAAMQPGSAFIQKPFTPEILLRAARTMLDQLGTKGGAAPGR